FGRKEAQRKHTEGAVCHHDQTLGRTPCLFDGFKQKIIELVRGLHIKRRNVGELEHSTKHLDLGLEIFGGQFHLSEGDWTLFGNSPNKTAPGPKIERQQYLAWLQSAANILGTYGHWID